MIDIEKQPKNINQYEKIILDNSHRFKSIEVKDIINCELNLIPWGIWNAIQK